MYTLVVSASGYRAWKRGGTPKRKRLTDAQLLALIRTIHVELKGAYGSPRITLELRARRLIVSPTDLEVRLRPNGIERLVLELRPEPAKDAAEVAA